MYAVSIRYFVLPTKIILTGTEGLAAATSYLFDSNRVFLILYGVFQAGLLIFAFIWITKKFASLTFLTVLTVLLVLPILPDFAIASPEPENERITLVFFGGLITGIAKAIALRNHGSTGDEDILSMYFAHKHRRPVGSIAIIAGTVSTVYGLLLTYIDSGQLAVVLNTLMYTSVYVFVSAETVNNFFRRFKLSLVTVITTAPERTDEIVKDVLPGRTYTIEEGIGGHLKEDRSVLHLVVNQEELPIFLDRIRSDDVSAFVYHHAVDGLVGRFQMAPPP